MTAGHVRANPACGPAVILAGDVSVVAAIADALHLRGIDAPRANCPAETAHVELHEQLLVVSIVDAEGRAAERRVADVATATALIESFASETALPGPRAVPELRATRSDDDRELPRIFITAPSVMAARGTVGIAAESSLATDGSVWAGIRAQACVDLGPVCVGGQARYATDILVSGEAEHAEASRSAGDLQFTVDYPLVRDGWSVTPGAGVGIGWLHVRRDYMDAAGNDTVEIDAGGLRASGHVTALIPLGHTMTATLGAAFDLAPRAHTQPFIEETREVPGEPRAYGRIQVGLERRW